jgi:hypothetical protein
VRKQLTVTGLAALLLSAGVLSASATSGSHPTARPAQAATPGQPEVVHFVFTQHGLPKEYVPGLVEARTVGYGRFALIPGEHDTDVVTGKIVLEDDNAALGTLQTRMALYSSSATHHAGSLSSHARYVAFGRRQLVHLTAWLTKSDDPSCPPTTDSGYPRDAGVLLTDGGRRGADEVDITIRGCESDARTYRGRGVDVVIHKPEACAAATKLPSCGLRVPVNVFAGQWTANTGGVGFRVVGASEGTRAIADQDGKPCRKPTVYYRGGYYNQATGASGKVTACTESRERLVGRYTGDTATDKGAAGGFDVDFKPATETSPATFDGTYTSDSTAGKKPYRAVFKDHFKGDGCCP